MKIFFGLISFFGLIYMIFLSSFSFAADTVRLQLKWYHQAQFAGFYVAKDKQFYEKEGLDVTFFEGGPGIDGSQDLLDDKVYFAVTSPEDILLKKSQGHSLTAIAAIYQKSAVAFLSRKDSGIVHPKDFAGKAIAVLSSKGINDFEFQFQALMKNMKVDVSNMTFVPHDPEYKGFLDKSVDITPCYLTSGLIKLKSWGKAVNIIYPGDYRVRFYSDTLATTAQRLKNNPDLILRFLKATLKGWQYAIENIDETTQIILNYARIKDPTLQKNMLEALVPLVYTGENNIGWMDIGEWNHMHQLLMDQNIIATPIKDIQSVFTTTPLTKIYPKH